MINQLHEDGATGLPFKTVRQGPTKQHIRTSRSEALRPSTIAAYSADLERLKKAGGSIPCEPAAFKALLSKLRTKVREGLQNLWPSFGWRDG